MSKKKRGSKGGRSAGGGTFEDVLDDEDDYGSERYGEGSSNQTSDRGGGGQDSLRFLFSGKPLATSSQ